MLCAGGKLFLMSMRMTWQDRAWLQCFIFSCMFFSCDRMGGWFRLFMTVKKEAFVHLYTPPCLFCIVLLFV